MPAENLVAAAFGRELQRIEKVPLDKSELLQSIKLQIQETGPRTYKLVRDLFSQLADWIKRGAKGARVKKITCGTFGTNPEV